MPRYKKTSRRSDAGLPSNASATSPRFTIVPLEDEECPGEDATDVEVPRSLTFAAVFSGENSAEATTLLAPDTLFDCDESLTDADWHVT